jgi:zinc protease
MHATIDPRGWHRAGAFVRVLARRSLGAALSALAVSLALPAAAGLPIEQWHTRGGAQVLFVENRNLPMLDVSVEFPAGSSRDTPATSGLAGMTLRTMRLGAGGLSEEEISRRLADVGAELWTSLDFDRAGYSLRTLSSPAHRPEAMDLLARILQQPSFPTPVVEREKARAVASLREAQTKPDTLGARAFAQLVYRAHPYALRMAGEQDTIERLSATDLAAFHQRYYAAPYAVVAIIGDIGRVQAQELAEQLTARLPQPNAPLPPLPPVPALSMPAQRDIAHPAAQAHIYMGAPGMQRLDPDYFPLFVGNYILGGGGFNSRFTEEVRVKRGLSYSVYSSFAAYARQGAFTIGLQTRKDQADEALRVVRETLARFIAEGPSERELEGAKQHIIGGFALRIDSNRKILDYLAVIGFYRLPLDWLERFPERITAVTAEQIRDAFQRRIYPERLATVVVGGSPGVSLQVVPRAESDAAPPAEPRGAPHPEAAP